jgi:3-oxoacyl-(acyl-carrier-protein) synthase
MIRKRVVVSGIGCLSSMGIGKELLWEALLNQHPNYVLEKYFIDGTFVGEFYKFKINNFDINNFHVDRSILDEIEAWTGNPKNFDLYYLAAAISLSLIDTQLNVNNCGYASLILAHENPGLEYLCENFVKNIIKSKGKTFYEIFHNFFELNNRNAYETQSFMFLYHLSKLFGIHGQSLIINNACASGLYAIETAAHLIRSGKTDIAIVAASDNPGIFKQFWLKEAGLYAEDGEIKPFAKKRNGFVLGDGASSLILEDFASAKKRNAHIYAEYLGGGFNQEAWKVSSPCITASYYCDAISGALTNANLRIDQIDLINAHGVGTKTSDFYEAKSFLELFRNKKSKKTMINALKPYIGHNLGGSSLLELAICLISLEKGIILPIINTEEIDSVLSSNFVIDKIRRIPINNILKSCCGFGGYNGAVVFQKIKDVV